MIALHSVSKIYPPNQTALSNIDINVKAGEFVFLAGASGAGKSTLLKLLYGAECASSGQVVVGGRNLAELKSDLVSGLRRDMGIVFQDYKLLARRSVVDNVAYGLEVLGVNRTDRRSLGKRILGSLGLEDRADDSPLTLSGGEQQRVAIARALIHKPKIVLADEPTGNLDREMSHVIFNLLLEASAGGVTVLVATHDLSVIEELNLRTIVLDKGRVLGDFEKPRSYE